MEYEGVLKFVDEEGLLGDVWTIRIIMHLLDSEHPVDTIEELDKSCQQMFIERQRGIPRQWKVHFEGTVAHLLKHDVIGYYEPIPNKWYDSADHHPVSLRLHSQNKPLTEEQCKKLEKLCAEQIEKNMLLVKRGKSVVTADEDQWFASLPYREKNKLHITYMLEQMEIALRRLLKKKYGVNGDWTIQKHYVPLGIIDKMHGLADANGNRRDGEADAKAERTVKLGGTPLGGADHFLNACTLGELNGIILYRAENFKDIFYEGKPGMEVLLGWLKEIRDPRAHADESLPWDINWVWKTKTLTDRIIDGVEKYLNR